MHVLRPLERDPRPARARTCNATRHRSPSPPTPPWSTPCPTSLSRNAQEASPMKRASACSYDALIHAACPLFMPTMTPATCATRARATRPEHPRIPWPGPYSANTRSAKAAMGPACPSRMVAWPEGRAIAQCREIAPSRAPWTPHSELLIHDPTSHTAWPGPLREVHRTLKRMPNAA